MHIFHMFAPAAIFIYLNIHSKKLKDRYNLTYGVGKDRVKREKLNSPDKVKYYIHDVIISFVNNDLMELI